LDQDPYHSPLIEPKKDEHEQKVSAGVNIQFYQDSVSEANEARLWAHEYQPCDLYVQPSHENEIEEGLSDLDMCSGTAVGRMTLVF
jgi:hypothetical protein